MKIRHIMSYTTNIKEAKVSSCTAFCRIVTEEFHAELKQ